MSDSVFVNMIRSAVQRTSKTAVADHLRISVQTVRRWYEGINLPHPLVRFVIARELDGM